MTNDNQGFIAPPPGVAPGGFSAPSAPVEPSGPVEPSTIDEATRIVTRAGTAPAWRLVMPDGGAWVIRDPTFVGRNPARTEAAPLGALLPLDDPDGSLSKTHALLTPTPTGILVTDLHSTNGAAVTDPGTVATPLAAGATVLAASGAVITLGLLSLGVAPHN